MPTAFKSNGGAALLAMACKHRGLALMPEWGLRGYFQRGELVQVTLEQPVAQGRRADPGISLIDLQARRQVPKVRVAVDFLVRHLMASSDGAAA